MLTPLRRQRGLCKRIASAQRALLQSRSGPSLRNAIRCFGSARVFLCEALRSAFASGIVLLNSMYKETPQCEISNTPDFSTAPSLVRSQRLCVRRHFHDSKLSSLECPLSAEERNRIVGTRTLETCFDGRSVAFGSNDPLLPNPALTSEEGTKLYPRGGTPH